MAQKSILDILEIASRSSDSSIIVRRRNEAGPSTEISYDTLHRKARALAEDIRRIEYFKEYSPIIIHLSGHIQTLVCFWAAICANAVPVILPQLSNDVEQRELFNRGLAEIFDGSVLITDLTKAHLFSDIRGQLHICTIENLSDVVSKPKQVVPETGVQASQAPRDDDLAMMLLTSGSTGTPKAVRLQHQQILAAVRGKTAMRTLPKSRPFLNWIGLDHVASMIEIHLPALHLGVSQIHVESAEMISNPLMFLDCLNEYRVARTFAPNFFLARLLSVLKDYSALDLPAFDFRNLSWLGSGGEANDTDVCTGISDFLSEYGAPANVLVPGFGMTETCAGAIYNLDCPIYDVRCGYAFASLGKCIPGIEYRLVDSRGSIVATVAAAEVANIEGTLEVRGPVVFSGYYRNEKATREAFTSDGWFKTGDRAIVDSKGCLCLTGRTSGTININGLKYAPQGLEALIEKAASIKPLRVMCFPFRAKAAHTERICVLYVSGHHRLERNPQELVQLHDIVSQTVMICTNSAPRVLFVDDESRLQVSTLGKVSRAKMKSMFEAGAFDQVLATQDALITHNRLRLDKAGMSNEERALMEYFRQALRLQSVPQSADLSLLDLGIGSIDLIRLKQVVSKRLNIDIPIVTLIKNPTVRSLAQAIKKSGQSKRYNPTVTLRSSGDKAPLWLVHSGVGEILVFMNLAKHIEDRPVHALRARGFEAEPYFETIQETVKVYCDAIRREQPRGPYAIAGYSYGAMIAFEIAKRLDEQDGFGTVRFFGSFNLPPHIKWRMKQLDWMTVFLHLCHFLSLIDETYINKTNSVRTFDRQRSCEETLAVADKARMTELSLDLPMLQKWTELSYRLQQMAVDYDPSGRVSNIDVFVAQPLAAVAASKDDWIKEHLVKWREFSDDEPTFHVVLGAHYTMLNDEHVQCFAETLKRALEAKHI